VPVSIQAMIVLSKAIIFALLLTSVSAGLAHAQEAAAAAPGERVIDIPLPSGGDQRALLAMPPRPKAAIVMLPGGAGDLGLTRGGDILQGENFVVRTRALWVARGFAVLVPDTIDGANLRGLRSSPQYARVVESLISFAHDRTAVPVFLLGTSQGSIAAVNGAAHAPGGTLAGLILTESVSVMGGSHETVFDADPQGVRIPALVLANEDDQCEVAPPAMAPKIAAAISNSPDVKVVTVSGGLFRSSRDCGSLTPHGYYGIEDKVVTIISDWMQDHLH
jgi:pimeloyl-ACP methyl ester carboxylesterase